MQFKCIYHSIQRIIAKFEWGPKQSPSKQTNNPPSKLLNSTAEIHLPKPSDFFNYYLGAILKAKILMSSQLRESVLLPVNNSEYFGSSES